MMLSNNIYGLACGDSLGENNRIFTILNVLDEVY